MAFLIKTFKYSNAKKNLSENEKGAVGFLRKQWFGK